MLFATSVTLLKHWDRMNGQPFVMAGTQAQWGPGAKAHGGDGVDWEPKAHSAGRTNCQPGFPGASCCVARDSGAQTSRLRCCAHDTSYGKYVGVISYLLIFSMSLARPKLVGGCIANSHFPGRGRTVRRQGCGNLERFRASNRHRDGVQETVWYAAFLCLLCDFRDGSMITTSFLYAK